MKNSLRIVFMGTPEFALKSLETLHQKFKIVGVVTAPDKKRGRGQKVIPTPVKEFAVNNNIPVLQPTNLKDETFIEELKALQADLNVIVAFRMLPEIVWNMPIKGSLNLHASLLPDYRGAAPINHAIINGETQTGVSTFFLQHQIDTGNIIMQEKIDILPNDNAGTLHDKLMYAGAKLLIKTIDTIENGTVQTTPQAPVNEKTAPKIFKDTCKIDWLKTGEEIHNFIRGLSPYPAAWTVFNRNGKTFSAKIFQGAFIRQKNDQPVGTFIITEEKPSIVVKNGLYEIMDIQPESKKRVSGEDFIRGLQKGDIIKLEE